MKVVCINAHKTKLKVGDVYTVVDDYKCLCGGWYLLAELQIRHVPIHMCKQVRCRKCRTRMPTQVVGMFRATRFVPLDDSLLSEDERSDLKKIVETT